MNDIIGRKKEIKQLEKVKNSRKSEFVVVYGRRRVGKTFLVREHFNYTFDFQLTGLANANTKQQLINFQVSLQRQSNLTIDQIPKDWFSAFQLLIDHLESIKEGRKKIVFFDELPWLDTARSDFMMAFEHFWNSWATNRKDILLITCGSAASWMIQKVVNHRGGLHNRITKRLQLKPFTLKETKAYLNSRNINFKNYQLAQLYMVMGGIPHYLKEIQANRSAVQNIDSICFSDLGLLKTEFYNLYAALFDNYENHVAIVRALGGSHSGLTREKIVQSAKLSEGGTLTKILEELIQSGFISVYHPFGKKKKGKLYRLTDEYSLFFLQFIENLSYDGENTWNHLAGLPKAKIWTGYAFENICFKHLSQIKKALSIGGVYSISSSFYKKGTKTEKGTQIDLLIDRNDHVINLFEIKFYNKVFTVSKDYAQKLKDKMDIFEETTKTRKQLFLILITTFGLKHNEHSLGLINEVLDLEDLFEE